MNTDIERGFQRALKFSFSKRKWLFVFPALFCCGVSIVLCRTLAEQANYWVGVSLGFLPAIVCAGILLMIGIPLIRIYHDEVKGQKFSHTKTVLSSWPLMKSIAIVTLPLLLADLVLWAILGLFYLVKNIPSVGHALGVVFSFGPFLLILGSLVLMIISLFLLFFLTPRVALLSKMNRDVVEDVFLNLLARPFTHLVFFIIGLIPLTFVVGLLILAAALTGLTYFTPTHVAAIAFQWFFIMIPFAALLSPAVVFFFNFAAESFVSIRNKK